MVKHTTSYPIELVLIGNQLKVTAIDPETGTEASVICPGNTTKKNAGDLALKKLHYVLAKKKAE